MVRPAFSATSSPSVAAICSGNSFKLALLCFCSSEASSTESPVSLESVSRSNESVQSIGSSAWVSVFSLLSSPCSTSSCCDCESRVVCTVFWLAHACGTIMAIESTAASAAVLKRLTGFAGRDDSERPVLSFRNMMSSFSYMQCLREPCRPRIPLFERSLPPHASTANPISLIFKGYI